MWKLDHKEGWMPKNWCFWIVVLEKTLESLLDCREIKPLNLKGNQSLIFTGRSDAETEAPIFWQPDVKSWLIGKDPDAGKDWKKKQKGMENHFSIPALRTPWTVWKGIFSISPSDEYSELISFRMDWFDPLAVQGTLKSLLQHHSSKASVLRCSAFFMVQLSHPYLPTGKTIALTRWTFVGKGMSLLFNMLSRLVIVFLPRRKHLLI